MRQARYKTHRIGGKVWRIKHATEAPAGLLGYCHYDRKWLYIPHDGESLADLDTIVHEALHAACPYLDETTVDGVASDIAKLLWRTGWRRSDES